MNFCCSFNCIIVMCLCIYMVFEIIMKLQDWNFCILFDFQKVMLWKIVCIIGIYINIMKKIFL